MHCRLYIGACGAPYPHSALFALTVADPARALFALTMAGPARALCLLLVLLLFSAGPVLGVNCDDKSWSWHPNCWFLKGLRELAG